MFRLTLLAGLVLAQPAAALSCLSASASRSFQTLNDAPGTYVVVKGTFTPAPGAPTEAPGEGNDRRPIDVEASFTGAPASLEGFDEVATIPVTVTLDCAGAWCGGFPGGEEVIAFLEQRDERLHLTNGPCPQTVLPASAEVEAELLSCLAGDACEAAP
jgi:hypothetical protein